MKWLLCDQMTAYLSLSWDILIKYNKINNFCKRIFLIQWLVQKVTKCRFVTSASLLMRKSQNVYQTEQLLYKKVFDSSISLESDKITALWPNDILTFTFYETFSNSIPNWAIFEKEAFWFDDWFIKWQNDWFVTKWMLYLSLSIWFNPKNLHYYPNISIFSCEASFNNLKNDWLTDSQTHRLTDGPLAFLTYFDVIWRNLT